MRANRRSKHPVSPTGLAVAMIALCLGGPAGARHDPGYEAIDLGTLGGGHSIALGINQNNEVVGAAQTIEGIWHAFLWADGQMTDLGVLPGFEESYAQGVNEARQVIGRAVDTGGGATRAFAWSGGNRIDLGTLGGSGARAQGINAKSHIVGTAHIGDGAWHAFLWRNGQMSDLGTLSEHRSSEALAINGADLAVGWSQDASGRRVATSWENGTAFEIGTLGGDFAEATALNRNGIVVGHSDTGNEVSHAFIWEDGVLRDLGSFPIGGDSRALSVNILREVVGEAFLPSAGEFHAVLWKPGRSITNINSLLPPFSGWDTLNRACGITDSGHVAGTGRLASGETRAFLLRPKLGLANPIPGRSGAISTFDATGATPFSTVHVIYGFQYGSVPVPICPGVNFGIRAPSLLRSVRADETGHALFNVFVPAAARHRTVLFQAVEAGSCEISIITLWTFL